MTRIPFLALTCLALQSAPAVAQDTSDPQVLVESGERLAALLRAGRSVVSGNQDLINNPDIGDKGLTPEVFLAQVAAAYEAKNGMPPVTPDLTEMQAKLTQAQLDAMAEVIAQAQPLINAEGVGFKGFIPAVFGRLTNETFGEKVGEIATVKVTAPPELVRNRTARPDDWELAVINDRFLAAGWETGAPWYEEVDGTDGPVFRMLIPEYYSASCLSCHGQPKGEMDVTGFPKEGGAEGELGGAISITLKP